ncbi:xanthine dehydrogenase family protein molybdopterin-binding subunit [Elusimicrobiota bacterium]
MRSINYSTIGKSLPRLDARQKVLGNPLFIDDVDFGGALFAVTLRSPKPRIRIKSINVKHALKVPGVVDIITARDIPGSGKWPMVINDYPFLADRQARFVGEAIALVVAATPQAANDALSRIVLSYKELPNVTDPLSAMTPESPKVFGKDNIFSKYVVKKGDINKGFKQAQVMVHGIYQTPYQVHAYIEPQGVIARPEPDGGVTVYGSMQCPYYVREAVSAMLGVSKNKVRIVQKTTGGGFGGKEDVPALVSSHAALAAWKTKKPVKLIYSREEDFDSMSKRHPGWVEISYGAKKDGTITACKTACILDGGAYSTLSPVVLWRSAVHAAGPYRIANVLINAYAVATNKVPCGAFRGFGQPQVNFANESLIDDLAVKLGMDPIDLRLKNALRIGDTTATGQKITESCGLVDALKAVRKASCWDKKQKRSRVTSKVSSFGAKLETLDVTPGIGVSANFYGVSLGARGKYLDRAGAYVQIDPDASVTVSVGMTEIGQGAKTVLAQIAAEMLNAPYENIHVMDVDTTRTPDSGPTVASRTTLMSGNAIVDACKLLRERIFKTASSALASPLRGEAARRAGGGDKENAVLAYNGKFKKGKKTVSFPDVIKECYAKRIKMAEEGWYCAPPTSFDMKTGHGNAYATYAYSANVAEVSVDTQTGEVKVDKITSAHDVGRAVNPNTLEGQVEGGVVQGLGYALTENLTVTNGKIENPDFADYVLPSINDIPQIKTIILEHAYSKGPYGAKGIAESPLIGPPPAITNAIYNACGVRVRSLPALPEKIYRPRS